MTRLFPVFCRKKQKPQPRPEKHWRQTQLTEYPLVFGEVCRKIRADFFWKEFREQRFLAEYMAFRSEFNANKVLSALFSHHTRTRGVLWRCLVAHAMVVAPETQLRMLLCNQDYCDVARSGDPRIKWDRCNPYELAEWVVDNAESFYSLRRVDKIIAGDAENMMYPTRKEGYWPPDHYEETFPGDSDLLLRPARAKVARRAASVAVLYGKCIMGACLYKGIGVKKSMRKGKLLLREADAGGLVQCGVIADGLRDFLGEDWDVDFPLDAYSEDECEYARHVAIRMYASLGSIDVAEFEDVVDGSAFVRFCARRCLFGVFEDIHQSRKALEDMTRNDLEKIRMLRLVDESEYMVMTREIYKMYRDRGEYYNHCKIYLGQFKGSAVLDLVSGGAEDKPFRTAILRNYGYEGGLRRFMEAVREIVRPDYMYEEGKHKTTGHKSFDMRYLALTAVEEYATTGETSLVRDLKENVYFLGYVWWCLQYGVVCKKDVERAAAVRLVVDELEVKAEENVWYRHKCYRELQAFMPDRLPDEPNTFWELFFWHGL